MRRVTALQDKISRPGDYRFTIRVGEFNRTYLMHAPSCYDGSKRMPLVVAFHGGGGRAEAMDTTSGLSVKAEEVGFLVAYPDATRPEMDKPYSFRANPQTWNEGSGRFHSGQQNIDDIGFVDCMLDNIEARFAVDKKRVYATGFSNGSSMTYYAGIHLAHRFAAIAPVSGHLWVREFHLSRAVPMIFIIGLADPLNPPGGGVVEALGRTDVKPSILEEVPRWAQALRCSMTPEVIFDRGGVKAIRYAGGREDSEVMFYTVEGLGHSWPGGKELLPENLVGKQSDKLKANDIIWEFFKRHPMK
jgi:polyhydroxybutyrate depolymerase